MKTKKSKLPPLRLGGRKGLVAPSKLPPLKLGGKKGLKIPSK